MTSTGLGATPLQNNEAAFSDDVCKMCCATYRAPTDSPPTYWYMRFSKAELVENNTCTCPSGQLWCESASRLAIHGGAALLNSFSSNYKSFEIK